MMLSDVCLSLIFLSRTSGRRAVCAARPVGWQVLADWARPGSAGMGSRLPLRASTASLGGGILRWPRAQLAVEVLLKMSLN